MTDSTDQPTELVDQLSHQALLDLAVAEPSRGDSPRPYTLPTVDQLQAVFSDLEIGDLLGTGGMGYVYRAHQKKLDRTVALKILPPELGRDALFAERFAREARAMARLNHPGIVAVYDVDKAGDYHHLIMEFMDGMNLRELLDAGPVDPMEALRIFEQVCLALEYAHDEGVVHRDVKPENILFDRIGHVALADFGLARLAMDSNCEVSLTQTRQTMGTLNYMAPEQWEDPKSVDHRADVYALGILLYELLTGRIPRGSFPPASSLCNAPAIVDDVINKALQLNAEDRFQSVSDLVEMLVNDSARADSKVAEEYRFSAHGTVTNFRHLGAAVIDRIPRPATRQPSDSAVKPYTVLQLCLCVLALGLALMSLTWYGNEPGVFCVTEDFLGVFVAPNILILCELALVCLLTWKSQRIHPLRARLMSLLLLGFCIAQTIQFTFDRFATDFVKLSIAPFVFLLLVCLLAMEFLVRTLLDINRWRNGAQPRQR